MCQVSGINSHNPQDKPRQLLATVLHHTRTSLLMSFTGSTGNVVHVHDLTGLRKAICESRRGYLYLCAWCAWKCESVALILSHKMDFNCCANYDGFHKSRHNLI